MQILAIDIGMGTQDILVYDTRKRIENCYKMVLPSPTYQLARRIENIDASTDLLLTGYVMGGGHINAAVKQRLQEGGRVYATPEAALTLHDNLEVVRKMGIITEPPEGFEGEVVQLGDVNLQQLQSLFELFDLSFPENIAVAVQDHGYAPNQSNRMRRFELFEEMIKKGGRLQDFAYTTPPDDFNRMQAVSQCITSAGFTPLVMDTGPAAICGALLDPGACQPAVVVNLGNGHTLGAVVSDERITALFEHHTSKLGTKRIEELIRRLAEGSLEFEEVFNDGGHGCYVHEAIGFENIRTILITGPNRGLMQDSALPAVFAAPFGDMMLSGCFGLVYTWMLRAGLEGLSESVAQPI